MSLLIVLTAGPSLSRPNILSRQGTFGIAKSYFVRRENSPSS
ncbi:MAG: hypothetical protein OJF48_003627 [Afipia sp.]|nr:MAG: hypothetical protein OJF48_003627 [Afipia sp.]